MKFTHFEKLEMTAKCVEKFAGERVESDMDILHILESKFDSSILCISALKKVKSDSARLKILELVNYKIEYAKLAARSINSLDAVVKIIRKTARNPFVIDIFVKRSRTLFRNI